jgi:molybdate/tungstate transport system permease protein
MKRRLAPTRLVLASAASVLVLFVALPLIVTLFTTTPQALLQTLTDVEVIDALKVTFLASAIATSIAIMTGLPLAYLLARYRFTGKRMIEGLMDLPIVIPHTAAGIALLMVFGSRGALGQFLAPMGIYFTENIAGIVIAMLFVSLPYLVNMSREAFGMVDIELEQAALVDGASPWQVILQIALPIAWRGVVGGALLMWARGISEFGAVIILAYHPKIMPVLVYERFEGFGLTAAQPVAVVLILVVLVVFGALRALMNAGTGSTGQ